MWICNYTMVVRPAVGRLADGPCRQLTDHARMLFVYFVWFISARACLFLPCALVLVLRVQSRTHGFCLAYCVHLLLRDGPLYIFVLGALLFWFYLTQSPTCDQEHRAFYRSLKLYAIYSNSMSMFCLVLAHWHNKIMVDMQAEEEHPWARSAPPDTISKLITQEYDERLFGDEEGKPYPSECAICLCPWEPNDSIKVTLCAHAFHEECLGCWLQTARTCALCRQDLASILAGRERLQWRLPMPTPTPRQHEGLGRPEPPRAPPVQTIQRASIIEL